MGTIKKPRKKGNRKKRGGTRISAWMLTFSVVCSVVEMIIGTAWKLFTFLLKLAWWVFMVVGYVLAGLMWTVSLISGSVDKDVNTKSRIEMPGH